MLKNIVYTKTTSCQTVTLFCLSLPLQWMLIITIQVLTVFYSLLQNKNTEGTFIVSRLGETVHGNCVTNKMIANICNKLAISLLCQMVVSKTGTRSATPLPSSKCLCCNKTGMKQQQGAISLPSVSDWMCLGWQLVAMRLLSDFYSRATEPRDILPTGQQRATLPSNCIVCEVDLLVHVICDLTTLSWSVYDP